MKSHKLQRKVKVFFFFLGKQKKVQKIDKNSKNVHKLFMRKRVREREGIGAQADRITKC